MWMSVTESLEACKRDGAWIDVVRQGRPVLGSTAQSCTLGNCSVSNNMGFETVKIWVVILGQIILTSTNCNLFPY